MDPVSPCRRPEARQGDSVSGVVLILVSGLAALLAMLALTLLQAASAGRGSAVARCAAARARLCAESGMDYAASRLLRGAPYPRSGPAERGDDWTFREGIAAGLRGARRPSWAHGDGRTGRLRQGSFSLKAESAGAKIPLNAGLLDALDRTGTGGGADHADLSIGFHAGLAHALNNLGEMILPQGHPRRLDMANENPREPTRYSMLGDDLVSRRPRGGYRSWEEVRKVLSPLGYTAADLGRLPPYVDLGPPVASPQNGPSWTSYMDQCHIPAAAVELSSAPAQVLESLFRYLRYLYLPADRQTIEKVTYPRALGLDPSYRVWGWVNSVVIHPDEAERLAAWAIRYRSSAPGGIPSWQGLYQLWMDHAESSDLDPYAPGAPSDGNIVMSGLNTDPSLGPAFPYFSVRYCQAKIDLVFAAVCEHPKQELSPLWESFGVLRRDWDPEGGRYVRTLLHSTDATVSSRNLARVQPTAYLGTPFHIPEMSGKWVYIVPLGLTTRPPLRFSIESLAGAGRAFASIRADLRPADLLCLTSQEDFENQLGSPDLDRTLGLRAVNDAYAGRSSWIDPDAGRRRVREVATLPCWPKGSWPPDVLPITLFPFYPRWYADYVRYLNWGSLYPHWVGGISLATREGGLRGADLYFPFGETDADTRSGFYAESRVDPTPPAWRGPILYPGFAAGMGYVGIGPLDPTPSFLPWARYYFNPFHVIGGGWNSGWGTTLLLEERRNPEIPAGCPGMTSGRPIAGLSFEGWFSNRSELLVKSGSRLSIRMIVRRYWGEGGIRFEVYVSRDPQLPPIPPVQLFLPEEPGEECSFRHFCLSFDRLEPPPDALAKTTMTLRIDGGGWDRTASMEIAGDLIAGREETIQITGIKDLRIYARALSEPEVQAAYRMGKFLRKGSYTSPLYVSGEPVRLQASQWTGVSSPFWTDASGSPADPISVTVLAYGRPNGTGPARSATLGRSGAVDNLAALGPARSFRYRVDFDMDRAVNVPVLADTPVFEGIWLTFRRRGMPPWTDWAAH